MLIFTGLAADDEDLAFAINDSLTNVAIRSGVALAALRHRSVGRCWTKSVIFGTLVSSINGAE